MIGRAVATTETGDPRGPVARVVDAALAGPESATALGIFRLVFVGLLTAILLAHVGVFAEYFSDASPINGEWARQAFPTRWSLFFHVRSPGGVMALFWVAVVFHVAWAAGAATPLSAAVSILCWVSMFGRNPMLFAYPDQFMLMMALLLALSPSGRAVSVDAWLRRRFAGAEDRTVPVWCRRLLQLQVAVLYTGTGLLKSGPTWIKDGSAIYFTLVNPYNRHFDVGAQLAAIQPWILRPATYLVLVWEVGFLGFVVVHWIRESSGSKRIPDLRWLFLGFGVLMHLGIQAMLYVVQFSALMLASYVVFLGPQEAERVLAWFRARAGRLMPAPGARATEP